MLKEEISKFVHETNSAPEDDTITRIIYNGNALFGYFENNIIHSDLYKKNLWNFNLNGERTRLAGTDIEVIDLFVITMPTY